MALRAHHLGAKQIAFCHFLPSGRLHATTDMDLSVDERHDVEAVVARLMEPCIPVGHGVGHHIPEADYCARPRSHHPQRGCQWPPDVLLRTLELQR